MSFNLAKESLNKFINIRSLCKSIELVTILTLKMFKTKIISSKKVIKLLFCYLKDSFKYIYKTSSHLLIPFITDKSCSGIVNNSLWLAFKDVLLLFSYKNILISIFGTGTRFQKNIFTHSSKKRVVANLYKLSNETVTFYTSFLLFREFIFLENKYFFIFFNEYVNIYNQVINYYLLQSLTTFISIFLVNEISFTLIDINILINLYTFFICILLLDVIESSMYSELGSRANSMSNSIQNAEDNVKHYKLIYNRYRQAKITNEIIEIVSSTNI